MKYSLIIQELLVGITRGGNFPADISVTCLQGTNHSCTILEGCITENHYFFINLLLNKIKLIMSLLNTDSLHTCCKHFAMIFNDDENSSPRPEVDHLLGHYILEGLFNDVFYYGQKTARHNIFKNNGTELPPKFNPIFLKVYQVRK